jgi:hypothetical protein
VTGGADCFAASPRRYPTSFPGRGLDTSKVAECDPLRLVSASSGVQDADGRAPLCIMRNTSRVACHADGEGSRFSSCFKTTISPSLRDTRLLLMSERWIHPETAPNCSVCPSVQLPEMMACPEPRMIV